jgi:hypothetical protein
VEKLSKGPNQPFYQASAASKVVSISTVRSRSQDFFVVDYSKLFL